MKYIIWAFFFYIIISFTISILLFILKNIESLLPVIGAVVFIIILILINSHIENKKAEKSTKERNDFDADKSSLISHTSNIDLIHHAPNETSEGKKLVHNSLLATHNATEEIMAKENTAVNDELFHDIAIEADVPQDLEYGDEKSLDDFEGMVADFVSNDNPVNDSPGFELSPVGKDRYKQMKLYENKEVDQAEFVPFNSYYPCYDNLNSKQRSWYFYWRGMVRGHEYPKTDLSYIYIYIYELLCGIGVKNPRDGLNKLRDVWEEYKDLYPDLNSHMTDWIFDYCALHNLQYASPETEFKFYLYRNPYSLDFFLSMHENEHPLKLSVSQISFLSSYKFTLSTFYKKFPRLIDNLIPRVISLIDIYFLKKYDQGLMQKFVPQQPTVVKRKLFSDTVLTNQIVEISLKPYHASKQLIGITSDSIRFSENVLRKLTETRGRVRKTSFEEDYPELAELIKAFVIKNYDDIHTRKKVSVQNSEALGNNTIIPAERFDLDKIRDLRKQSEGVRAALEVTAEEEVILLTDVTEIQAILAKVSDEAKNYIVDLQLHDWNAKYEPSKQAIIDEINRVSGTYIARDLIIVTDDSNVEIEYDYRDELEYIYQNNLATGIDTDLNPSGEATPELNTVNSSDVDDARFDTEFLPVELVQFVGALTLTQKNVLIALLTEDSPYNIINDIANQTLSMPQQLLDEINNSASDYLGELLLEFDEDTIEVIEPYKTELKKSIRTEE